MSYDFTREREEMVERQIRARGITNSAVIDAMRKVKRHLFVPETQRFRAYDDSALPVSQGQTISQPYIVAYMTELLEPDKGMRLLEIGTGTGYQSAIAAEVFCMVYTIEIIEELGLRARELLLSLGYRNIEFRIGDGFFGWEEFAPFDRILLTAAPPKVPENLIRQLRPGGILAAPVGINYQRIIKVTRGFNGESVTEQLIEVRFVRMTGEFEKIT